MSEQNLSTLSDIPEEKSASLSVDSLENTQQFTQITTKGYEATDELNCTQTSNVDSPSFHNILSSSHCEASSHSKQTTSVGTIETSHHLTVDALFIREDVSQMYTKPHHHQRQVEIVQEGNKETSVCENSDVPAPDSSSKAASKDTHPSNVPPKAASKSVPRYTTSKTAGEHHSKIPVPVRSSPVAVRLRQSIEKCVHIDRERQRAVPGVEVSGSSHKIAASAPKAAERSRSHHTIERPKKDFIQLNKQGEFRRTKTYHTLHLERRDVQRSAEGTDGIPAPITTSSSAAATADASTTGALTGGADRRTTSAANLSHPSPRDRSVPSGQAAGVGSSPQGSDPCSPAGASEGSSGRRSSRIPVRTGSPTSPRRHRSHESPRSHVSRHERHVSRHDRHVSLQELNESRLEFHASRLSYDSSESELVVPRLRLPHSQLSLIDVNDNRPLVSLCVISCQCDYTKSIYNDLKFVQKTE